MIRHQLGQNLVLCLDLLLQIGDSHLLGGMVGWPLLSEGSHPVLEELLQPAIEDCGREFHLIAELRDRLLLKHMSPQDGDLLFRLVVLPLLLHAFSPLP